MFTVSARAVWQNIVSGLWLEDVYGFSITDVGWFSEVVFLAEFASNIFMILFVDRFNLFVFSFAVFGWQACVAIIVLVLAVVIGDDIGGIFMPFLVNISLYVMFEMEFVSLLMAIVKYRPSGSAKYTSIVAFFAMCSLGRVIGSLITPLVWDYGNGLCYVALICLVHYLFCIGLWMQIYRYSLGNENLKHFSIFQKTQKSYLTNN